jgi:CheY-like chemotaxis protein
MVAELSSAGASIEERFEIVHKVLNIYRPELADLLYSLRPLIDKASPHEILDRISTLPVSPEEREILMPAFFIFMHDKKKARKAGIPKKPAGDTQHEKWVIVADDEDLVRRTFKALLEHEGYKVQLAGNGSEVLKLFESDPSRYCVVITDLKMPQKDGIDVITGISNIQATKGAGKKVPVVVITAFVGDGQNRADLDLLKKTGMLAEYFIKPVKIEEFLEKLHALDGVST